MASSGIEDDPDVRAALEWFYGIAPDAPALIARVQAAQTFYREGSIPHGVRWPETSELVLKDDLVASYLAQADALLHDRRSYDLNLGARVVPFIKRIGNEIDALRGMPGATDRVRGMLRLRQEHPAGALYELVTAARYAHEGFAVEFVPETSQRTGDLRLLIPHLAREVQVECKRLQPSQYEQREAASARALFASPGRINSRATVESAH